mgnify:CR=1 FL=1
MELNFASPQDNLKQFGLGNTLHVACLLYTSDAADE